MKGRALTLLLILVCLVYSLAFNAPGTWPDAAALVMIPSLLTFIIGFCRGYWVADWHWKTEAHKLADFLERDGVPVVIVPPGGTYTSTGRPL